MGGVVAVDVRVAVGPPTVEVRVGVNDGPTVGVRVRVAVGPAVDVRVGVNVLVLVGTPVTEVGVRVGVAVGPVTTPAPCMMAVTPP